MGGVTWLEYLNDPQLVANFQKFFGVIIPEKRPASLSSSSSTSSSSNTIDSVIAPTTTTTIKRLRRSPRLQQENKCINGDTDYEFDVDIQSSHTTDNVEVENEINLNKLGKSSHTRNISSSSSSGVSSSSDKDSDEDGKKNESADVEIRNKFFYYLFHFGTSLGDEVFYAFWFCFWFWNVDGAVGRRVVLVWGILMYIGQGLKDIIRWPRPRCPPVVRLEKKWEMEYGMPSTHAVVGAAVPFSTLYFTANRYQYSIWMGATGSILWCTLVCLSRLYLGMHSVLDILAGLTLVGVLFMPIIPFVDWLDPIILQSEYGGICLFLVAVVLCLCTPGGDRWTPARGDTFVILGSCTGLIMGGWLNFQMGVIRGPPMDPPYHVIWPSYSMIGQSFLRLVIGLCMVAASRAVVKAILHTFFHRLLKFPMLKKNHELNEGNSTQVFAELSQKFLSYVVIGLTVIYLSPAAFRFIGIERPTFHTEV